MAILSTGNTFADGDQVTSTRLNNIANAATFAADAVDDSTTALSGGKIIIKDGGVTPAKLSTNHPNWDSTGLGVGTSSPSSKLDVETTSTSADGIDINNTSTGDPVIEFQLSGTSKFTMGVDNSDSDKFKIGTTAVETGTALTIDSTGPKLTIGNGAATDSAIIFDGNAQDFYIALDDSADDLIIGLGSTVGTTPAISVDENRLATFGAGITSTAAANTLGATSFNDADITNVGSIALDTITNDGTDVTIDSSGDIILDADGADVIFKDAGTAIGTLTNSSSDFVISSNVSDKDIIFKGNDGGVTTTVLTLDMSAAGDATFNNKVFVSGDLDVDGTSNLDVVDIDGAVDMASTLTLAGNADFNGDLDVDGTTNLDVVDIDGAVDMASTLTVAGNVDFNGDLDVDGTINLDALDIDGAMQVDGTLTVGVNDTGYDVKFFGATSGAYMLWDESADDLVLAGAAGIDLAGDLDVDGTTNLDAVDIDGAVQIDSTVTVGVDDQGYDVKFFGDTASAYMLWDTSADDLILGGAARLVVPDGQLVLASTAVSSTAAELNLLDGSSANTVVNSKAVIYGSSGELAGTLSTAAQGNVTSLGTLTTLTVDNVIINGSTIGHTGDTDLMTVASGVLTVAGEVDATSLDISGDADIAGTTNLDAVDIDGAVQIDSTVTVGVDDTGYDVKFFGATASAYMLWDASTDDLILGGAARLGIGTTSPAKTLHIASNANSQSTATIPGIRIENTDTTATSGNVAGEIEFFSKDASEADKISGFIKNVAEDPGTNYALTFGAKASGSHAAEAVRIDADGNVGIADNNPSEKLSVTGNAAITGSLSKGSGSFRIPHPIEAKSETHHLVHSFLEGPQADLIYRGKVDLIDGVATVNVDTASGMTDGTFTLLCRDVQSFTTNESGWTAVRSSVSGNTLTIEAQDNTCTDSISWMVVGERQDKHMLDTGWTDATGKVIVEPLIPERQEPPVDPDPE
jgi:cytoskeletal protein CcmA (bactofilin family)